MLGILNTSWAGSGFQQTPDPLGHSYFINLPLKKIKYNQPCVLKKTLGQQLYNIGADEALFVLFEGLYKVTSALFVFFFFYGSI